MMQPGRYRHYKGYEYEVLGGGSSALRNGRGICGASRAVRQSRTMDQTNGGVPGDGDRGWSPLSAVPVPCYPLEPLRSLHLSRPVPPPLAPDCRPDRALKA